MGELVADAELDVAAELNVGAAAGHVGGDGDDAVAARLRHDMRLALMLARVQHLVLDAGLVEVIGQGLRFLDRHRADQHRLPLSVASFTALVMAANLSSWFL
jgi:hypothetical protein